MVGGKATGDGLEDKVGADVACHEPLPAPSAAKITLLTAPNRSKARSRNSEPSFCLLPAQLLTVSALTTVTSPEASGKASFCVRLCFCLWRRRYSLPDFLAISG